MGQSCFTSITISFKETPGVFKDETALKNALIKYHKDEDVAINLHQLDSSRIHSNFDIYSSRASHLKFQVDLLIKFLSQFKDEIVEFDSDAYTSMDSCSVYIEGEDF